MHPCLGPSPGRPCSELWCGVWRRHLPLDGLAFSCPDWTSVGQPILCMSDLCSAVRGRASVILRLLQLMALAYLDALGATRIHVPHSPPLVVKHNVWIED